MLFGVAGAWQNCAFAAATYSFSSYAEGMYPLPVLL
jgi:hypothetical protein